MSEVVIRSADADVSLPAPMARRSARSHSRRRHVNASVLVAADALAGLAALVLASGVLAWALALPWAGLAARPGVLLAVAAGVMLPALWLRLYAASALSPLQRFRARFVAAALLPVAGLAVLALLQPVPPADALLLSAVALAHLPLSLLTEAAARAMLLRRGLWGDDAVVIGSGEAASAVAGELLANPLLGLRPVATWTSQPFSDRGAGDAWPGEEAAAMAAVADVAVIAAPCGAAVPVLDGLAFRRILVVTSAVDCPARLLGMRDMGERVGIELGGPAASRVQRIGKRALDLAVAVPALVFVLPLMALTCLAIRLVSPGRALFRQTRVGWKGEPVGILKLRSMYRDADRRLEEVLRNDPKARAEWETYVKLSDDPRILPVIGDFIRRASIDELPQLWNVIRGDISLVGPRPFPAYHVEKFDPAFQRLRSSVRPGLTGLWQVTDRSGATLERQQMLDSYYIRNWSLWLDLYIVWRTLPAILSARGAR